MKLKTSIYREDVFMNILITCIGVLQENAPVIQYNKGIISAQMTSETYCKYLLKKVRSCSVCCHCSLHSECL